MKVTFWGVRGSFPVAQSPCLHYGGNTPCVEVEAGASTIVIDAGTGIDQAGKNLVERGIRQIDLLISHTHWDHVQGFPHFAPLYRLDTNIRIYGPKRPDRSLEEIFAILQQPQFSSTPLDQIVAKVEFIELQENENFSIGDCRVQSRRLNHPGVTYGYRIEHQDLVFSYICDADIFGELLLGDHLPAASQRDREESLERLRQDTRDLAHRTDMMVCDTFFMPDEYDPGWGHSRPDDALRLARETQTRRLVLFHHRPERTDDELAEIFAHYQSRAPDGIELLAARERLQVIL